MTTPRLVKRQELLERKQSAPTQPPRPATHGNTVSAVIEWVSSHRLQRPDARQAFAALFGQPHTS
jgi:hypothetical protein